MSLLGLIITLLVVGVLLWAVSALPFIDAGIKKIIYIVVVVFVCLWLISALFGGEGGGGSILNSRIHF
jgi:cation transporter-like permease